VRVRRTALSALLAASFVVVPAPAHALVWPDVPERIERDLSSGDAIVRTLAVEKVDSLGRPRATPLLLRALADGDAGVRLAAATTTLRMPITGATELVIPWLAEHDTRLRLAACAVARALPDPRAIAPLARALSDADAAVRASAVEALGSQRSVEAVAPLLGKLDDGIPAVRVELARALARIGDRRAVMPLIGKVEDSVPEVRQAVAHALGDLGDARAAPALLLQLRDASAEVRAGALSALGRVHGVDAVDAIAPLVTDRNAAVRRAALETLGSLAAAGSTEALHVLLGRLGVDDDGSDALGQTPLRDALVAAGDLAIASLREMLRTGTSPSAATTAAWVLGALHASSAASDLVAALRRGTLAKAPALHALAAAGGPDQLPVVLEFVGDANPSIRSQALLSARAMLDPAHPDGRAVDPLLAVARSPGLSAKEQLGVIELLGRTGARRAGDVLLGLVHSRDFPTRVAALDALAALGPIEADPVLVEQMKDEVPEVRLHAANTLGATGGAVARDALLNDLTAGAAIDRMSALTALRGILVRAPSDTAWKILHAALRVSAGGERDAILLVLGRTAPIDSVVESLARAGDATDRRSLAAAVAGRAEAAPLLRRLLSDEDTGVQANAAWGLGSSGAADAIPDLRRAAAAKGPERVILSENATAALGRIAARTGATEATSTLCSLLHDARATVQANALAGLALAGARCADGAIERDLLTDRSETVRESAARAIGRAPHGALDAAALNRCGASDRSGRIAWICEHPPATPSTIRHEVLAYVETFPRSDPQAGGSFLVELGDGLLRGGTADRQGAFYDPSAPEGPMRLVDDESALH